MRGALIYGPGDVRFEERADPVIPLAEVADAYRAMDDRRAVKVLEP